MGILYSVATPIGNLEDITYRAVHILQSVQLILCEDTRVTKRLADRYTIKTPLKHYDQFTLPGALQGLIQRLLDGSDIALVTDAGTPGISDPGSRLVQAALAAQITVCPIPGPSACIAALQASGVDSSEFIFLGFLPHKHGRQTMLAQIVQETRTVIVYESPHRLLKTLAALRTSNKYIVVARELTKIYEEFVRGSAEAIYENFSKRSAIKGEFVLIISCQPGRPPVL
ncbi:MAG: methyltransferase [uncultured bacterium]|nr:MAG: methyltransferase [uncultured bacterium]